jgi:hypothetical protein
MHQRIARCDAGQRPRADSGIARAMGEIEKAAAAE